MVGLVSGSIGGGTSILAALTLLCFDAKKVAYAVSFVEMDWALLGLVSVAAILGGFVSGRVMHFRLNAAQVKKLIAVLLLLLATKMIWDLI